MTARETRAARIVRKTSATRTMMTTREVRTTRTTRTVRTVSEVKVASILVTSAPCLLAMVSSPIVTYALLIVYHTVLVPNGIRVVYCKAYCESP